MELLTIKHTDFTLSIECSRWEEIWCKAKNNVKEENLYSTYSWSEGVDSVVLTTDEEIIILQQGTKSKSIFFDNADYSIWVDFNDDVENATFVSELKNIQESFSFHKKHHILSGFLNYGNDIGKSEIQLTYRKTNRDKCTFIFSYEVLSTKLNYHDHWAKIVEDIEAEYRMLSIDYLRRTFHSFKPDTNVHTPELVWWNIFKSEQEKFITVIKHIIERPRHKLRNNEIFLRADKLKRLTPHQEQLLTEHKRNPDYLYRADEQLHSHDTMENRFLKYALNSIANKYNKLKTIIEAQKNISDAFKVDLTETKIKLERLRHNAFFRSVGPFKGLKQESQILQKASDYSQVYRIWCLLRKGYSLNDGIYRLQTKDIATLYEIWCFIEVSHIVKELLGENVYVDHRNRMEMNGVFTWELGTGEHSRILFKKDGVDLAELVYNPKYTDKENNSISMDNVVVPTVAQKPDIILQLTKHDLQKKMKMTYLFDAKYRIDGRSNGVDTPPEDAINQMHRYRDAIYYKEHSSNELKKEVIGGYILFPGDGQRTNVEVSKFYKTIDEVNIGAFPLRPKDVDNRELLVKFIKKLISKDSSEILDDSIPQKGLYYSSEEPKDSIYMILTLDDKTNEDVHAIINGKADVIVMGRKGMEEANDIQTIRYIAPIMPGSFIYGYYKVKKASLKRINDVDYPLRIKFDVSDWVQLKIPAHFGMAKWAYRGVCKTRDEFIKHCRQYVVADYVVRI